MPRYEILGMPVDRLPPEKFAEEFVSRAKAGKAGYVCVPNVSQCVLSYDDPSFATIVRGADRVMSDSKVLHRFIERKYDLPDLTILRGDLLTLAICGRAAREGVPIALVGGRTGNALERMVAELKRQCPGLAVAYAWSPPFRELTGQEEVRMLANINASGARLLFCGLGGPKQERWMARYANRLPMMMIGVGAAFDFISGQVKTSPSWMHGAGLEWLHRLVSEPGRLWRRYLSTSPRFIWLFLTKDRAANPGN